MPRLLCLAFLLTLPAHAQWEIQNSTTTADLRGIHSIGNGVAWASGTNGTVLRTEDGGYLWQSCSMPPGAEHLDFRGIQAFDANTAIVMSSGKGDLSRLYKTTDGCHSWKLIFKNPDSDGFWDALYIDREQLGWLLGDPVKGKFTLFASNDRGRTWNRRRNKGLDAKAEEQGAFAASNSSIGGPYGAPFFVSGGTGGAYFYSVQTIELCIHCSMEDSEISERHSTWGHQKVPVGSGTEGSGAFSVAEKRNSPGEIDAKETLVVVGGDYQKPNDPSGTAAYTTDEGKTWQPATSPPHGYRSAVAYEEKTKTWITVGPNGTDVSTDDGRTWRALHPDPAQHQPPDADRNWNALSLPFVVGPHGRIGKLIPAALAPKSN
jgi:photosystem II stability/assembly factor-like uncharacterized protein